LTQTEPTQNGIAEHAAEIPSSSATSTPKA
jgi:hypothetical protein